MPIKDREGAIDGGKVCSYKGPTLSSSTTTIPLVSRNGNEYEYLQKSTWSCYYTAVVISMGSMFILEERYKIAKANDENMDKIVARIEERISTWIFVPKEYGKPLQAQHIGLEEAKQQYHYFGNKSKFSEPVMATIILYLSNASQGGQIFFPELELGNSQMKNKILSDCTKSSYALRPTRGNALLFFNLHPNTTPDQSNSHARCPVLDGEMWFATKFFHAKASDVQTIQFQADDSDGPNEEKSCPQWAAIGECQRNPIFMIGSPDYYGTSLLISE
ncbi:hypothetical protein RJ639_000756 [Escallonia herrerae]|uniref:Prolyl 4-hydroxylase alpha subunit domain-containing protein n=1 Tax=Escallonia herrerae TaxID=1293975 RepID=A0AA88XHA2_9ASTE|nr:hypothetical protein RJ639_000756 [Escallonia herrerae]